MALISHRQTNLCEDAKAGLSSLLQQVTIVFLALFIMLLATRGEPSSLVTATCFCFSTLFIAWKEKNRVMKRRVPALAVDSSTRLKQNRNQKDFKIYISCSTLQVGSSVYKIGNIEQVKIVQVKVSALNLIENLRVRNRPHAVLIKVSGEYIALFKSQDTEKASEVFLEIVKAVEQQAMGNKTYTSFVTINGNTVNKRESRSLEHQYKLN